MRRSFGGNRGMGGGGGGGGGMLRTVQRAVRAGVGGATPEPFSHSTTNATTASNTSSTKHTYKPNTSNILSLSSSTATANSSPFSSSNHLPISADSTGRTWGSCSSPVCSDEFDWECVEGFEDVERGVHGFCDDFVFGSVPSMDEVHQAVSSLQQVLDPASFSQFVKDRFVYASDGNVTDQDTSPTGLVHRVSSSGSESDWIEPSMHLCNPIMLQPYGSGRVYDAFHLLQTEPSVQKMVISLSSDKAVWDAILNNEVVREIRESFNTAEKSVPESSDKNSSDDSNAAFNILSWIFDNTKVKVMEVIDKITTLVNELFQTPPGDEKTTGGAKDSFEEKLRTSFMLSVVVFLIVVVTRAHRA